MATCAGAARGWLGLAAGSRRALRQRDECCAGPQRRGGLLWGPPGHGLWVVRGAGRARVASEQGAAWRGAAVVHAGSLHSGAGGASRARVGQVPDLCAALVRGGQPAHVLVREEALSVCVGGERGCAGVARTWRTTGTCEGRRAPGLGGCVCRRGVCACGWGWGWGGCAARLGRGQCGEQLGHPYLTPAQRASSARGQPCNGGPVAVAPLRA